MKYLQGIPKSSRGAHCTWHEDAPFRLRSVLDTMSIGLTPAPLMVPEILCTVCGVYFGGLQAMRIHCSKTHADEVPKRPDTAEYRRTLSIQNHSVNGMPPRLKGQHGRGKGGSVSSWNNDRSWGNWGEDKQDKQIRLLKAEVEALRQKSSFWLGCPYATRTSWFS